MGTPAHKFRLYARPQGVGPADWPSTWQFEHAYNPGHYPPTAFYWDQTKLMYEWCEIGLDGIPDSTAPPADDVEQLRIRAGALLRQFAPFPFEFQIGWDHGECVCTRDYHDDCPVHFIDAEGHVVRITAPTEGDS